MLRAKVALDTWGPRPRAAETQVTAGLVQPLPGGQVCLPWPSKNLPCYAPHPSQTPLLAEILGEHPLARGHTPSSWPHPLARGHTPSSWPQPKLLATDRWDWLGLVLRPTWPGCLPACHLDSTRTRSLPENRAPGSSVPVLPWGPSQGSLLSSILFWDPSLPHTPPRTVPAGAEREARSLTPRAQEAQESLSGAPGQGV